MYSSCSFTDSWHILSITSLFFSSSTSLSKSSSIYIWKSDYWTILWLLDFLKELLSRLFWLNCSLGLWESSISFFDDFFCWIWLCLKSSTISKSIFSLLIMCFSGIKLKGLSSTIKIFGWHWQSYGRLNCAGPWYTPELTLLRWCSSDFSEMLTCWKSSSFLSGL